ncbi:Pyrrolo-quinoline quinone repeat-containing protein OS=Isosphaera pallida (strain ATCC 43644 / DSM 9630 / IS1B) GN=Isop_2256 PE=4 SV=1: PQQ: PQQ_2 [Gemmata massiliana]|uniref:Pyrrolo-quinoline quinone repeat domain-containing protein n=1 Tax=Gemmata massiliana TaxID=1210884 RepID=A0A6P2CTD9_9BACT|nr:PQQ-binding-like beta-propeller repeat protein [Gemmata massiliana]VTR92219.1 Pyrrolo-quinoline quinone repeat-containing protein OS=Isosphaera pallida (strain ATCC 43644 / DSM 9630 / IS1B) GN=Isop_2256 PE=4 SV=1: PQQ: PQQ_2 [Gemmata massiliana]
MWHRLAAVVGLALAAGSASAQQNNVYSKAIPPEKAVLDRLNLRTEWSVVVPVEGNRDTLSQVQTIGDQVFVQTRTGTLAAIDALTGRVQWTAQLGNGTSWTAYPVAANANFVFAAHVTKLYAFYRYTGVTEFVTELGTTPTTGLVADNEAVYCVLGTRSGSVGSHRIVVFQTPAPIVVTAPARGETDPLKQGAAKTGANPVDDLVARYAPGTNPAQYDTFDQRVASRTVGAPVGGGAGTKTPSLSTLPSVSPPYSLDNRAPAPSLNVVPSLRQPYRIQNDSGRYIQQSASLSTIPPSVGAAMRLSDLRPKGVEPKLRWEYGLSARVLYPLTLTPTRVWGVTDDNGIFALSKQRGRDERVVAEVSERLMSAMPAAPVASGTTHYIPFANGTLIAIDATGGNLSGGVSPRWRSDPGGLNNHSPFVTKTHLYAAGDNTGVVCLNRATGDIVWRSDNSADRVIGANEELVYIRDRQGRFLVYDAKRPTDPARQKSAPLGSANFSDFNINVVNTASDRVYLAADNGLIVCLRDAAAKYAKPVTIWPPPEVNRINVIGVDTQPGKGGMGNEPKKDTEPKKEPAPKSDSEPKKDPGAKSDSEPKKQ